MNREIFEEQMARLKSEWPNSYGVERQMVLWDAFKNENDVRFIRAVTRCIQTLRSAPLLNELLKSVEDILIEDKNQARERAETHPASIGAILQNAANKDHKTDPDFVKACMKIINDDTMTPEQRREAEKYIQTVADQISAVCKYCNNQGYVHPRDVKRNCTVLMRCFCAIGSVKPQTLQGTEIHIPTYSISDERYSLEPEAKMGAAR